MSDEKKVSTCCYSRPLKLHLKRLDAGRTKKKMSVESGIPGIVSKSEASSCRLLIKNSIKTIVEQMQQNLSRI